MAGTPRLIEHGYIYAMERSGWGGEQNGGPPADGCAGPSAGPVWKAYFSPQAWSRHQCVPLSAVHFGAAESTHGSTI